MYSIKTTAKKLGVTIPTIHAQIKDKRGIGFHFKKDALDRWVVEEKIVDSIEEVK